MLDVLKWGVWYRYGAVLAWALLMASAQGNEPVRVLTEHSPPGEYLDDTGRVTGATAEMVRELMRRQGLDGDITLLPWARAYAEARQGPRVALFETTRTEAREPLFKWVGPIKRIVDGLYARAGSDLTIDELEDARSVDGLCAYLEGSGGNSLEEQGFSNLERPTQPAQCLRMLMRGRVDLWLSSDIGHPPHFQAAGIHADAVERVHTLSIQYLYIAFSRDTPDTIVADWQATLDEMKRDGALADFYRGVYPDEMIEELSEPGHPDLPWLD